VDGLVDRPQSFTLGDLSAIGLRQVTADFHCVSGWSVAGVRWSGVRVAELLDRAAPRPEARALRFESADGAYVDFLDLASARAPDVLVALSLGGAPLKAERGAPARLVVPFFYGYRGVKGLSRVRAGAD